MDWRPVLDIRGNTITRPGRNGQTDICCMDEAGHEFWRPLSEFISRARVADSADDPDIHLRPPQAEQHPARPTQPPQPPPPQTAAERRAERQLAIEEAREARRQAEWERQEAERHAEEQAAQAEAEARERAEPRTEAEAREEFWISPFGGFLGCAIWFFGPPLVFFPIRALCWHYGWEAGAMVATLAAGLAFWVGYLRFLHRQDTIVKRRELRARLDAAAEE